MELEVAAGGFGAMGSEARLDVLRILIRAGAAGLSVSEIQERSGIAPSTLAHHLKFLAAGNVVLQERQGRSTITRANFDHLRLLADYILCECCMDVPQEAANDG
ncbi:helix-turn-helix domain-containing protein [Phaeobacter sp. CNT1-3]|jgi:DNA-binding transcriptional ArsR family regulator|nr:helix-turn-helix domain-containing protein [Phaeobacter sp. CNT1-3]